MPTHIRRWTFQEKISLYDLHSYTQICIYHVTYMFCFLTHIYVYFFYRDDTKVNVDKLKPFTLYQFKVRAIRHDTNQTSLYSESIECYTNEDGERIEMNCHSKQ